MQGGDCGSDSDSETNDLSESDDEGEHGTSTENDTQNETSADNPHYHRPLYDGCAVTVGAAIVLIMALSLRHNLPWVAVEDILTLLQFLLPSSSLLPRSRFMFEKLFRTREHLIDIHYYCPHCFAYLSSSHVSSCAHCKLDIDTDLYKSGNFFLHLPLEHQLRDMFENSNFGTLLSHRFDRHKTNIENIEDVYDGSQYQKIMGDKDASHISLTWNTDGVPIFESSKYCMWPIQCLINELPVHLRKKHALLAGLWFGTTKPSIDCFLRPFVSEVNRLATEGFNWLSNSKHTCKTFVHAIVCSADAVARCMLQGIKQFNGKYGCSWCLHPGERVEKGDGSVRVYPHDKYDLRTHLTFLEHAKQSVSGDHSFGVMHASRLLLLHDFDIVCGFAVDYMHCVLLGVTRTLTSLWFDSDHHTEPYYIGRKISDIDKRLLSIRPPSTISRAPRSITLRCYWKASEWRNWLLMYAVLCVNGILPAMYLQHFMLLVCAIDILYGSSISAADLTFAEVLLDHFIIDYESLYGKCHLSYNIHQLSHLPDTVRWWGPLWTTSAFPFESGNGLLSKLFNGTQGLPIQVSHRFTIFRSLPMMAFRYIHCENVRDFLNNILTIYAPVSKVLRVTENICLLGRPSLKNLTSDERLALDSLVPFALPHSALYYTKAVANGCVISVDSAKRLGRRNNSCIVCKSGVCGIVQSIVVVGDNTFVLLRQLTLARDFICVSQSKATTRNIKIASSLSETLIATRIDDFERSCIFVNESFMPRVVCMTQCRYDGD